MRRVVSALAAAAALVAACGPGAKVAPPAETGSIASIVEPYLKIHEALAADDVTPVKANAGAIATAAASLGAPGARLAASAIQLAAAADLTGARNRFGLLSEELVAFVNGLHVPLPEGVRVAFCPMVQTHWLQRGTTIANPYYGTRMPTCGEFK